MGWFDCMQKGMEQQQGGDGGCWTSIWTGERAEKDVRKGRRGVRCAEAQRKIWKRSAARTTARTRPAADVDTAAATGVWRGRVVA
jgi:hypothetical protein